MSKNQLATKSTTELLADKLMGQVNNLALQEQLPLTKKEKSFAIKTIAHLNKKLTEMGINLNALAAEKCMLPLQIKAIAKLGLDFDNHEVWLDIRNNKDNPVLQRDGQDIMVNGQPFRQKDVFIKKQYQGIEKEIVQFCTKNIVRFKRFVVLKDEKLLIEEDFKTGKDIIVGIENKREDHDTARHEYKNIHSAVVIAYEELENGDIIQHWAQVDKNRLDRAKRMKATNGEGMWGSDTLKMVLKTASWELYKTILRPYIVIPDELRDDYHTIDKNDYIDADYEEINDPVVEPKNIAFNPETGEVTPEQQEVLDAYADSQKEEEEGLVGEDPLKGIQP